MNYIRLIDGTYPLTEAQTLMPFPGVIFPDGYAVVFPVKQPAHDVETQYVKELSPTLLADGTWEQSFGVYTLGGELVVKSADRVLPRRTLWANEIDDAVLAIYARPTTLADEYKAREADAVAYKAAGYTGTVPARVSGFATPAGMTPKAATDLILAQAAQMRGALAQLADLRMQKYAVTRASTEAEAQAAYTATMTAIAAIAAALN